MTKHTAEPWEARPAIDLTNKPTGNWVINARPQGRSTLPPRIAQCPVDDPSPNPEGNARRIVACVNAMAGIPDPEVARRIVERLARFAVALKDRDCPEMDEMHEGVYEMVEKAAHDAAKLVWGEKWDYEPTEDDEAMYDALTGPDAGA